MRKIAIVVSALLVSSGIFAQKDELKTLKKIYDKDEPSEKDVVEYKSALTKLEPYLASAPEGDKVLINYFKAEAPFMEAMVQLSKPENQNNMAMMMKMFKPENVHNLAVAYDAMRQYEKVSGKSVYTKDIDETVTQFSPMILNAAIALGQQNKYAEGGKLLYDVYLMDKTKPDNLFYAASYAVNGQDYENALSYYNQLKAINYSGEGTTYIASEIVSGKEQVFGSKAERDKAVSLKLYNKPREEKNPSKKGEIYKNIALILVQQGKVDEAKSAYADAIKENPSDTSLLMGEANLFLQLKDNETYKQKVAAILAKDPNNADLVYNIGVLAMEGNHDAEAIKNFERAIQINPEYANAYMNLSVLKLKGDEKLVKEMNSLGTSEKDNKRYEVLKKQRTETFTAVLPLLEKAHQLAPDNEAVSNNLLSVYNFLEMSDKYKALKAGMKK